MGSWHSLGAGERDTLRMVPQSSETWFGGWTSKGLEGARNLRASGLHLGLQERGERVLGPREQGLVRPLHSLISGQ